MKPVPGALTPVVPLVSVCVDFPRFGLSVMKKNVTSFATCPPSEESRSAQEQVLLEPGRVPGGVRLAVPVRPALQQDAETEVHVVVDLDDRLGAGETGQQRHDDGQGDESHASGKDP